MQLQYRNIAPFCKKKHLCSWLITTIVTNKFYDWIYTQVLSCLANTLEKQWRWPCTSKRKHAVSIYVHASNHLNLAVSDYLVVYQNRSLRKRDLVNHKKRGEFINESELVSFWVSQVYDVVQLYPWFQFWFSLFKTQYDTVPYPKTIRNPANDRNPKRKIKLKRRKGSTQHINVGLVSAVDK